MIVRISIYPCTHTHTHTHTHTNTQTQYEYELIRNLRGIQSVAEVEGWGGGRGGGGES